MEDKNNYKLDPTLETVLEEQMIEGGVPESEVDPSIEDIEESMDDKLKKKKNLQVNSMDHNSKGKCECWDGYKRVPGTKPCAPGSCEKCDAHSKNSSYDHKFEDYKEELREKGKKKHHGEKESSFEVNRSSIPDEHLISSWTPEELEEALAVEQPWDGPEEDRPAGWGEEIVESPKGIKTKRIIDPDLEKHERKHVETKVAADLENTAMPTQGFPEQVAETEPAEPVERPNLESGINLSDDERSILSSIIPMLLEGRPVRNLEEVGPILKIIHGKLSVGGNPHRANVEDAYTQYGLYKAAADEMPFEGTQEPEFVPQPGEQPVPEQENDLEASFREAPGFGNVWSVSGTVNGSYIEADGVRPDVEEEADQGHVRPVGIKALDLIRDGFITVNGETLAQIPEDLQAVIAKAIESSPDFDEAYSYYAEENEDYGIWPAR